VQCRNQKTVRSKPIKHASVPPAYTYVVRILINKTYVSPVGKNSRCTCNTDDLYSNVLPARFSLNNPPRSPPRPTMAIALSAVRSKSRGGVMAYCSRFRGKTTLLPRPVTAGVRLWCGMRGATDFISSGGTAAHKYSSEINETEMIKTNGNRRRNVSPVFRIRFFVRQHPISWHT